MPKPTIAVSDRIPRKRRSRKTGGLDGSQRPQKRRMNARGWPLSDRTCSRLKTALERKKMPCTVVGLAVEI